MKYLNHDEVIKYYQSCGSQRETAKHFGVDQGRIRKILISNSIYPSVASEATATKISKLLSEGVGKTEIIEQLHISESAYCTYVGYKKTYNSPTPTQNALRIRKCREKKEKPPV